MKSYILSTFIVVSFFFGVPSVYGQKKSRRTTNNEASKSQLTAYQGFFNYSYDAQNDKIYLEVRKVNEEFLYINSLAAGVGSNDIGLDRGQLGNTRVVRFEKHGNKLLLIQPNYDFRAVSTNEEESKSVQEAFAQSVIWGFNIQSAKNDVFTIDLTDFLLRDAHGVSNRLKQTNQGAYKLDRTKSALYLERTKSFPDNSEFEALLTFTGDPKGGWIRSVTPTPGNVTVRQHHSFVKLPDNKYKPRKFDPRSGYYVGTSYQDYATPISESLTKRFISRHRLAKKDPSASISEAVEPIVYYLDRGAPEPIRSALLEGARWWNQAFEAAGYKDAFKVELLPEGADPLDVRYNVIQWVHRSTRGWSYGASVRDPRTGEIIKGHVSLGSLRVRQDFLIAEGLLAPYKNGVPASREMEELALARLRQLSAHEVGHTLGLAHSYSSSTEGRASVMDYPHPLAKITDGEIDVSDAYDQKIGAWDKISIAYGYQDFPQNKSEKLELEKIIQEGLKQGLTFISDQDARPQSGAHPYAHLWDNGKNVSDDLKDVLEVRKIALKNFGENNLRHGFPLAQLEEVLVPIYFYHRYQVEAVAKLIGGLNYRYALKGDGQPVTEFVPTENQKEALDALIQTLKPETLTLPESIIKLIPPRPIGYRRGRELVKVRTGLTFDPIGASESAANLSLSLLLNPARAQRLVEYHARNNELPSLEFVLDKLVSETVKAQKATGLHAEVQKTVNNLTVENIINLLANKSTSGLVKGITQQKLNELLSWLENNKSDAGWEAHYAYLKNQIESYLDDPEEYEQISPLSPPDGSPIGTDILCHY